MWLDACIPGGGNALKQQNLDLDRPNGADHDRNTYCYKLVSGAMVLKGIILGAVIREFDATKLSCYKEREDKMAKRQAPPYEELKQAFMAADYKIDRLRKEYQVNWMDCRGWLKDAGLIDSYNKPTDKSRQEPVKSMGVVEAEAKKMQQTIEGLPEALKQACQTFAPIEPVCVVCGKTATVGYDYCGEHAGIKTIAPIGVEVPQYEPTDNDFQAEDEEPIPYLVEKVFDPAAFKLEVIENIIEMSGLRHAPKEITLEMISGIIGS